LFGDSFLTNAIIGFPVIVFSLSVHEFSHAYMALRYGDTTARDLGRLTLNPLAHLDIMGVIVMVLSQFTFGWAKPVPVNPYNLRNPRVADIWISAAGPISNLIIAAVAGIFYRIGFGSLEADWAIVPMVLKAAMYINIILAVFNLIPLFPLDGSHILRNLLPEEYEEPLSKFERFAPILLIVLVFSGALWVVIGPPVNILYQIISGS
jgi:Zn-dependent protease